MDHLDVEEGAREKSQGFVLQERLDCLLLVLKIRKGP
jgi:hypothetical protein